MRTHDRAARTNSTLERGTLKTGRAEGNSEDADGVNTIRFGVGDEMSAATHVGVVGYDRTLPRVVAATNPGLNDCNPFGMENDQEQRANGRGSRRAAVLSLAEDELLKL